MTPAYLPRRLRERLRRRKQRSDPPPPRSRVHVASFEHTHRVWEPDPPPRRWFVGQGIKKWK